MVIVLLLFLQSFLYVRVSGETKITGVRPAVPAVYTYVVSVQRIHNKEHVCGGVLLTEQHVLSACSCMVNKTSESKWKWEFLDISEYKLIASGTDSTGNVLSRLPVPDGSTQPREIKTYYIHPQCRREGPLMAFADDLMVFIPVTGFTLTKNVSPMKLYSLTYEVLNDKILNFIEGDVFCEVAGYGIATLDQSNTTNSSSYLNLLDVKLINNHKCRKLLCLANVKYCGYNARRYNQICAVPRLNTPQRSGPCTEDVGGPLVCKGFVYGILSWSLTCGNFSLYPPMMFQSLDRALNIYKDVFFNATPPHIKSNVVLLILCILIRIRI